MIRMLKQERDSTAHLCPGAGASFRGRKAPHVPHELAGNASGHICAFVHACVCIHLGAHLCMFVHCACVYMCALVCMYVFCVYFRVCMHFCVRRYSVCMHMHYACKCTVCLCVPIHIDVCAICLCVLLCMCIHVCIFMSYVLYACVCA